MRLWNAIVSGAKLVKCQMPAGDLRDAAIADDVRGAPVVLADEIAKWARGKSGDEMVPTFCARAPFPMTLFEFTVVSATNPFTVGLAALQRTATIDICIVVDMGSWAELIGTVMVPVDDSGAVGDDWKRRYSVGWRNRLPVQPDSSIRDFLDWMACVCLATLTFMNCKNVTLKETSNEAMRKAFERRRGCKPLRYHVLNIESVIARTRGASGGLSMFNALHMCRGHFKTFTKERPLFGKVAGRFWWGYQARGTPEAGVVVKDYRVKP